jgi:carboxyl-terminal processing protease
MKKQILILALAIGTSAHFAIGQTDKATAAPIPAASTSLKPIASQTQAALLASRFLARSHYKAMPLDDAMSEKIFDRYFKSLDSERMFFLQSDIDEYAAMRTRLDDAINNESLQLPFAIYATYQQRFDERIAYARELLKTKPDFTIDESFQVDREKAPWLKTEEEAREVWRKRVKNDWLRLKLAGKDEKGIRETLDKRYENYMQRVRKFNNEDVFQIFMNAYAMSIEPHTNYLGPRSAENFDIAMRLSLEGIGAVLQTRDDYTVIREVVPGSPADKSGKIKVGDRVIAVAQADGPYADVMGWRLDDVVALIRGAKDSVVRLQVLPADAGPDGKAITVSMVRKKISMEEQSAKKSIIEVKTDGQKRRVGVISLPTFYHDFEARRRGDREFKSATRDVARLLRELKKEKVDTVLVDLRNNGGGSLMEAVELTGLFIDKGPVVQQRAADGKVDIESDTNSGLVWNGPVGVLINRGSASASEIFAAAIQDYGRGIILGESSFGKGTVQTMVPLDRYAHVENARYGELKMTIAQFFRINGGTTQLRGVIPDIKMPALSDPDNFGESSYDNALPWTTIKAAYYVPSGDVRELVAPLQKRHEARIAKDPDFKFLTQDLAEIRKLRKENSISLVESVRRKERDQQELRAKQREQRLAGKSGGRSRSDDGLQADERSLKDDIAAEKAAKAAKDIILTEAANVMADEVSMLRTNTRLASRVMPYMPPTRDAASN